MATAEAIITNINNALEPILLAVSATGYVAGVMLVAMGLFKLRKVGDYRSMMYQPVDFFPPMVMILSGVMLMYLPGIFEATTYTIFTTADNSNLLSYAAVQSRFTSYQRLVISLLQVIGLASFIRGWILVGRAGGSNAGPGGMSKGVVHIIAGVLCYHIYGFYQVIKATLGI